MIVAQDLHKRYGSTVALAGVSLDVRAGETLGLLGPNGAGKTTFLHLLAGVLRPDAGSIRIGEAVDPTLPAVRRKIGIAPQAISLYQELTADENLHFFGRLYDLHGTALHRRVDDVLARVGLTDRRGDLTRTYSGGMARRLNLACALLHDPPVLLLDEPTVGVDPQSRNHLFETVEALAREGRTLLYTTHYMEEAQRLCDRVAVFDQGKILALDTVPSLLAKYGGKSKVIAELERPVADLPADSVLDGTTLRFESDRPLDDLVLLKQNGMPIRSFRVDQPDLESVFLALTGRRLRDE